MNLVMKTSERNGTVRQNYVKYCIYATEEAISKSEQRINLANARKVNGSQFSPIQ